MQELLDQLETLIEAKIKAMQSDTHLWTYEDIAHFCRRAKNTIINDYSKRPDFPRAIRFDKNGSPVYLPKDVKAWVLKHAERAA
jgi:phage pi2 protein 07